jgi:F0F1-type ATP synthase epsilon subunit
MEHQVHALADEREKEQDHDQEEAQSELERRWRKPSQQQEP